MIQADQLQNEVILPSPAKRIVSLVPSQTELIVDLGLEDSLVGITKFCVHPQHIKNTKVIIGGTKDPKPEVIHDLKPDLIIANKEENRKSDIEHLRSVYPVYTSDITDLRSMYRMIMDVGNMTDRYIQAKQLCDEIVARVSEFDKSEPKTVLYLIWQKPYMVAGHDTFINSMLKICGLVNIAPEKEHYPEISIDTIAEIKPDLILLSSEPYPFKDIHRAEFQKALPGSAVMLVDGEAFSWYGSRLISSLKYLQNFTKKIELYQ